MKLTIEFTELEMQALQFSLERGLHAMMVNKNDAFQKGAVDEAEGYNTALIAIGSLSQKYRDAIAEQLD